MNENTTDIMGHHFQLLGDIKNPGQLFFKMDFFALRVIAPAYNSPNPCAAADAAAVV
jgi:hypothetical protein